MRFKLLGAFAIAALLTSVSFTNCGGQAFEMSLEASELLSQSLGNTCEDKLANNFKTSLQPFFSNASRCLNCHTGQGPGIGSFANANARVAMDSALSIGVDRLLTQSKDAGHKPPYTGSQNTAAAEQAYASWKPAYDKFVSCKSSQSNSSNVVTISKSATVPTISNAFQDMEFNLSQAGTRPVPMRVKVGIRQLVVSGETKGYEISNPRASLITSGDALDILSVRFIVNGSLLDNVTTYTNMDVVINSVNDIALAPSSGSAAIFRTIASADQLALEVTSMPSNGGPGTNPTTTPTTTPTGSIPTYTELIAAGGIFQTQCVSCHRPGNARGSLDLTVYNQARVAASNIKSRINNAANPMPTGGLMSASDRATVSAWVDGGAPQ